MDVEHCGLTQNHVLIDEQRISARLDEIAADLDTAYADTELLIIGVLTGAFMTVADLCRRMSIHVEVDWVGVSSYGSGTRSSGAVQLTKEISAPVKGRHVLIVDDILDSGLTISWLTERMRAGEVASVESCVLLRKPAGEDRRVESRYVGFDIPDVFAVGYGLDHAGRYRNLRCIAEPAY